MARYLTYTNNQTLLFYHPSMSSIANDIAIANDNITLGTLKKKPKKKKPNGSTGEPEDTNWPVFADGWPNLFIEGLHQVKLNDCVFLACLNQVA